MICWSQLLVGQAQEPFGMPRLSIPDKTPDVLAPGIRPDAIIMRNGMGESVFVPKSRYEDFERYLSAENDQPFVVTMNALERMDISVKVVQAIAQLKIEAQANLVESNSRWLSIPIALGAVQAIPSQRSSEMVPEFPSIRISNDSQGYVWRVSPGAQGERNLQFAALSNVRTSPQGQSLRLDLPLVPTIVRFELPIGPWELNVIGSGNEVVEPFQEIGTSSIAVARTSGGTVTFNWAKKSVADQIQAFEVESQTKYMPLMEAGEFRAVSNLAIRGPKTLGGRRFLITLPDRSKWREPMSSPSSFPGYRFGKSEETAATANTVLLLEFEEAFSRTEIELPIEWQTSNALDSDPIPFSMLRVEGIQRHVGSIDVGVPRNVSFQWEPQAGIQFNRQSQASDGNDTLSYSFRFNQQNEPLKVHWNVGDRASDLMAVYDVAYDSGGLHLNGTIDILGDVRQLPFLQLDVQGWVVDRVQLQPSGRDLDLVAIRSRSTQDADGTTSIPLSLGELLDALQTKIGSTGGNRPQPEALPTPTDTIDSLPLLTAREDSIRQPTRSISFVLSRPSGPTENADDSKRELGFSLPMLSWLDPAQQRLSLCVGGELTIQSAVAKLEDGNGTSHSIKRIDALRWKQGESITLSTGSTRGSTSTLKYRVAKSKTWTNWKGIAVANGTAIQGSAQTRIAVTDEGFDLSQTWSLVYAGGIAKTLRLAVPKVWLEDGVAGLGTEAQADDLQLTIDHAPVEARPLQDGQDGQDGFGGPRFTFMTPEFEQHFIWLQLILPNAEGVARSTNEHKLTIRKRLSRRDKLSSTPTAFDLRLPWIAADKADDIVSVGSYIGDIIHPEGTRCILQSPLGGRYETLAGSESGSTVVPFDRTQLEPRLTGKLSLQAVDNEMAVDVESVWLQTIVNAVEQRDRFVVRLRTRSNFVSLRLPAMLIANGEYVVNGRKAVAVRSPSDVHRVDILLDHAGHNSTVETDDVFVLEVFLWSSNNSQWLKTLQVESPSISNCRSRAPLVWQIVVPTTVHLIGNTSTLSHGYRWKWQDLWFERKSDWNQDTIGSQLGATSQPFVSQQTNQYVFFSQDHTVPMRIWLAPRYLLWAPVASFVLIASFFIMEFRWIRRPWISIFLLLSSLTFSQWAWDLSIALVQCLIAAIGIAVMYSTLKWVVDRRARRRSVFALRPSSPMIPSLVRVPSLSASAVLSKPVAANAASPAMSAELPASTTTNLDADGGK